MALCIALAIAVGFIFLHAHRFNLVVFHCKDGLLSTVSRYYSCDEIADDDEILNNRTWLARPTYLGTFLRGRKFQQGSRR